MTTNTNVSNLSALSKAIINETKYVGAASRQAEVTKALKSTMMDTAPVNGLSIETGPIVVTIRQIADHFADDAESKNRAGTILRNRVRRAFAELYATEAKTLTIGVKGDTAKKKARVELTAKKAKTEVTLASQVAALIDSYGASEVAKEVTAQIEALTASNS